MKPVKILTELFCFLLDVPSIEGTVIEQRIREKSGVDTTTYKLKAQPKKNLSRNRGMYTDEQVEKLKDIARDYLYFFNYVDHPTEADPTTTFFTYADGPTQHD